jgi:hypothetical protein
MAIKNGKPNPLNYFDLRRVNFPAEHFHYANVPKYTPALIKSLNAWIYSNLNNRYYIGQGIAIDKHTNSIIYTIKIGFEQEKELSFFKIAGPQI